jgi:ABC-type antimicrobial peptide transport system permease subunit
LLASIFAVLAVALTVVGVAGLTARGVAYRMRELCIRMALGATTNATLGLVMQRAVGAACAGMAVGIAVAPLTSRWLADYLFEVPATDLVTYAVTLGLSVGACVLAGLAAARPLRRANLAAVLREQ